MTSTDRSPRAKKSVTMSMMIGTLLVPLVAYAASTLVQTTGVAEPTTASEAPVAESAVTEPVSVGADLETACGEAGLGMVAAETTGTIGELQQAALDALRGVCAEQGLPLPAPTTTQPAVTTVAQPQPSAPVSAEGVPASEDDDHDDDHGRHGGDDDEDDHGRHGGDDEDDHHGGDHD